MTRTTSPPRVLVVGLGRSGVAAARLAAAEGARVRVTDLRGRGELAAAVEALPADAELRLGGHPPECLEGVQRVVVSPGVPPDASLLLRARDLGVPVESEVEFAWRRRRETPLVAVTGSNGKSTVTTLVGEMLRASGRSAAVGGNLGTAASALVLDEEFDVWVLEVSSFQTELFVDLRPEVGVFLNLSQDHLERHPDMEGYARAKQRLFGSQRPDDVAVLNADDRFSRSTPTAGVRRTFSVGAEADACLRGGWLVVDGVRRLHRSELRLTGRHNLANALAAVLAAEAAGADPGAVAELLRSFPGLEHRHRVVRDEDGVRWVDDSKATNVGATLAGLEGYPDASVHLILGGLAKGQDFTPLLGELRRCGAGVYLIGRDAEIIARQLTGLDLPVERCGTLETAVSRAAAVARPGQVVLLAPACASFDQFSGFEERGRRYAELVRTVEVSCR